MIGDDLDLEMVYIRWNVLKCGHWIGKIMIDHWFLGYPMLRQTLYTIYIYMTISSDIVWKILLRQQHVWFSQELSTTCIFWGWFTHDAHGLRVASLGLRGETLDPPNHCFTLNISPATPWFAHTQTTHQNNKIYLSAEDEWKHWLYAVILTVSFQDLGF